MKPNNLCLTAILALAACDPSSLSEASEGAREAEPHTERDELLQRIEDLETDRQALQVTLDKVGEVLRYLSVTKDGDLMVSGANLRVVNGRFSTPSVNGKGNLIVGYDEAFHSFPHARTGSHNLVIGLGHEYLGHSGIVAGDVCLIEGASSFAMGHGKGQTTPY